MKHIQKIVLLTVAMFALLASQARAAHATNFLAAYETEVDARLAALVPGAPAAEKRALFRAAATLDRNSTTLQADLGLLVRASLALDTAFDADPIFTALENVALGDYADAAEAQRQAILATIGDAATPRALSNLLQQASAALDQGNAETNSTPERAHAISLALTKLRAAAKLANNHLKAPVALTGEIVAAGRETDRQRFTIVLNADHTYSIAAHGDEEAEIGTWTYERTGAKTATITLIGGGGGVGALDLTFRSANRGTFRGEDTDGESVSGKFTLSSE